MEAPADFADIATVSVLPFLMTSVLTGNPINVLYFLGSGVNVKSLLVTSVIFTLDEKIICKYSTPSNRETLFPPWFLKTILKEATSSMDFPPVIVVEKPDGILAGVGTAVVSVGVGFGVGLIVGSFVGAGDGVGVGFAVVAADVGFVSDDVAAVVIEEAVSEEEGTAELTLLDWGGAANIAENVSVNPKMFHTAIIATRADTHRSRMTSGLLLRRLCVPELSFF